MKVLDAEKVITLLENVKKFLQGKSGILPQKYFSKATMDFLIQGLQEKAIDLDILENAADFGGDKGVGNE